MSERWEQNKGTQQILCSEGHRVLSYLKNHSITTDYQKRKKKKKKIFLVSNYLRARVQAQNKWVGWQSLWGLLWLFLHHGVRIKPISGRTTPGIVWLSTHCSSSSERPHYAYVEPTWDISGQSSLQHNGSNLFPRCCRKELLACAQTSSLAKGLG